MSHTDPTNPVRLALVGAGIFARDAHVPALRRLSDRFAIVAVHSRSQASAAALAEQVGGEVALSTDLDALLARPEIDAVDVVLPIPVQAEVVARALASGKHVISEKPIAPELATAQRLIEIHRRQPGQVWLVAENWRYEEAFVRAAEIVRSDAIGRPLTVHWAQYSPHGPSSKYYQSEWRRSGSFTGGLLLDGGVHYTAALRLIMGEIESVAAHVTQVSPDLLPADTLTASLRFANGAVGTFLITFGAATPWGAPLTVVGERGSLRVERGRIEIAALDGSVQVIECAKLNGVDRELAAFADAVQFGAGITTCRKMGCAIWL